MTKPKIAVCYCLHDDHWYLSESIESFRQAGPVVCFISTLAWNASKGNYERCVEVATAQGAEVVIGNWADETSHRRAALIEMKRRGFEYLLTPDGDEVIEEPLLDTLLLVAKCRLAEQVNVHMDTYWKSREYVIRPRERLTPLIMLNLNRVEHVHIRGYEGGRCLTLEAGYGVLHHYSYSGPDERIRRKLATWSHREEVVPNWYSAVWSAWDTDHLLRDLHPTLPSAYGWAERIAVPPARSGHSDSVATETRESISILGQRPKVSVIIPLFGAPDSIRDCLASLTLINELLHEVIVVDDVSPDCAPDVVLEFPFARLLRNERNIGFGATCNRGFSESSGSIIVFLNSDTVVPRSGFIKLIECIEDSGSVAAVGPFSNHSGYHQKTPITYSSVDTLELFAEDFAVRDVEDMEVDMLVGFCLAIRRSVLDEIGVFDERFGKGMFEDNDLCYRMRRKGYILKVAGRSFIHHEGSKSILQSNSTPEQLLHKNKTIYEQKWERDIQTGFASHISGQSQNRIVFREERRPERIDKSLIKLVKKADISLCMIVRNEERVLNDCLQSASRFFNEVIIVDTGSTDQSKEIAARFGAKVIDYPWTDSFADARNESLKHAKGRWIFWMDADDTMPPETGEALIRAVLNAPDDLHGFVVPVQFLGDGINGGTRVDHVKMFRNFPGVKFEGRIHEQILGSLREKGGTIARLHAVIVHSGYDTSDEGQQRKRERDSYLLKLDLDDRPAHPFVLFNLGMTAHYSAAHEEAIDWLRQSISVSNPGESHVRKAYCLLAISLRQLGRTQEAFQATRDGLRTVNEDPDLRFQAGLILTDLERYQDAKAEYLAAPEVIGNHFSSIDIGILGFKKFHNIGLVCLRLNEYPEAKAWFEKAIADAPTFMPSVFELFGAALERKDFQTCELMLEHVRIMEGATENWSKMTERLGDAAGGLALSISMLRRAVQAFPGEPGPKIVLARKLLNMGEIKEAQRLLLELNLKGHAEAAYCLGVIETREGRYQTALEWMERAQELDPTHVLTNEQVLALKHATSNSSGT